MINGPDTKLKVLEEKTWEALLKQEDPTSHSGVVVKTESGKEWSVHKGQDYGKSSATVVVDTKHMSDKWTRHETQSAGGKNVGSFVETGGSNFNLLSDNCHQSAKRMMK